MSLLIYVSLLKCEFYCPFKQEVKRWKTSLLQGIVRPPMGCHTQTLPRLDSASHGMKVGSSMTQGLQTASFSLQHRLRGNPLVHPLLLMILDWLQIMPF